MRDPLSLFRAEAYVVQLERLRAKALQRGRSSQPESEGVSLWQLSGADGEVCSALARDVHRRDYRFAALRRTEVWVDGKCRTIHRPELLDALVLGALSARLTGLLETTLSDSAHAYRPGRSSRRVVERLRQELARHRQATPPKERGLFVLQRDLSAYGESIPTHPRSALWPLLDATLRGVADDRERSALRQLFEAACRPTVILPDGQRTVLEHGLPTGSPIQQPLANLYLMPVDEALDARSVFYARFGDDLFVATPDLGECDAAATELDAVVRRLELAFNPHKTKNLYFTKPGRPLERAASLPLKPTSHVEYLGTRIDFEGRVGFTRKRLRQLLQRAGWRIENSARLVAKERARATVAGALNQALTGTSSITDPAAEALRLWVDDRRQLAQIDHLLALRCAEVLSGKRGVRAFRHTSIAALRKAGLSSLLELRRRARRSR